MKGIIHIQIIVLLLLSQLLHAKTTDIIMFGNTASEAAHSFSTNSTSVISGALSQTARQCNPLSTVAVHGGDMTFTVKIDPVNRNYITLKFWGGDESTHASNMGRLYLYIPVSGTNYMVGGRHESDYTALSLDGGKDPLPGRFYYSTTMLPLKYTKGKTTITLQITSVGRIYDFGSGVAPSGNFQYLMDAPSRGIYKVFSHTEAMLDVSAEVNGSIPATTSYSSTYNESMFNSGGAYCIRVNNKINSILSKANTVSNFNIWDAEYLAQSYSVQNTSGYQNEAVVKKVVTIIDLYANQYFNDNTVIGTFGNDSWGGPYGILGYSIYLLRDKLQNWLDVSVKYAGTYKTRREAWGDLLIASRDYGRISARRTITNQQLWANASIYKANKGLLALADSRAFSEIDAQRYLKEAVGLLPWLGPDLETGGSNRLYGSNYYQITKKGLSREWGYCGTNYGEITYFPAWFYRMTGNEEFRQQTIKMIKARAAFRRPAIQKGTSGYYWAMEGIGLLSWRGVTECDGDYADQLTYGERVGDVGGMLGAASTLDSDIIAYAKQWLSDNTYFDDLYSSSVTDINLLADYQTVKNAVGSGAKLPMSNGQPDFVWSDEENGIMAIKKGEERLWIEPYWQALAGVNGVARFHYSTPTYDQYGVMETAVQYRATNTYNTRSSYIDNVNQANFPDNPINAYAGELLPIAYSDLMPVSSGVNGYGKADYYALRFGKFLVGINASINQTGTLRLPIKTTTATELISNATVTDSVISVSPLCSKVLYLNTISDSLQVPTPPMTFYMLAKALPKVYLRWSDASGAVTYNIKRSEKQGGPYTKIATGLTGASYTDPNGTSNSYYVISAVNANGESLNSAEVSVSGYNTTLAQITSTLSDTTQAGIDYSYSIATLGSPVSFDATGLPSGLSVNKSNGIISGRVNQPGIYSISISVVNSTGTATATLNLTVTNAKTPIITSSKTTGSYTGLPFSYKIEAINGANTFFADNLPAGFSVDTIRGLVSGKFPSIGTYKIAVKAKNSAGIGSDTVTVSVQNPPLPSIVLATTDTTVVGRTYSHSVQAYYATKYTAVNLPAGLSIDSITGEISGVPTVSGLYYVLLKAYNVSGAGTGVQLPIKVWPTPSSPWVDADVKPVGTTMNDGYSFYVASPEAYVLNGAGSDIGGTSDSFQFLYRPFKGNGDFVARLAARSLASSADKVGIMMRASENDNAACVFLTTDYGAQKVRYAVRSSSGAAMSYVAETSTNGNTVPIWYKLTRSGSTFSGSMSLDGTTWTTVGSATVTMNDSIITGLAECSRTSGLGVSKFDKVAITYLNTGLFSTFSDVAAIYPNPFNDHLTVTLKNQDFNDAAYYVSNTMGQRILSGQINLEKSEIDMRNLPVGIYIFTLKLPGGTTSIKAIKKQEN